MNYLDRNEFNYAPSQEVVEALKNFDINKQTLFLYPYLRRRQEEYSVCLSI